MEDLVKEFLEELLKESIKQSSKEISWKESLEIFLEEFPEMSEAILGRIYEENFERIVKCMIFWKKKFWRIFKKYDVEISGIVFRGMLGEISRRSIAISEVISEETSEEIHGGKKGEKSF